MPYKPPIPKWIIAAIVIIVIIIGYLAIVQKPPAIVPTPTPTLAILSPTPSLLPSPSRAPTPTDEPIPTIIVKEPSRCGEVSKSITLNNDLSSMGSCFKVTAADVTIDCANYAIKGELVRNSSGIESQFPRTIIKNCNIASFGLGARLRTADGSVIEGSVFSNNLGGILIESASSLIVKDNNIANNTEGGLMLASVADSEITGNFLDNNLYYGIQLIGSEKNLIRGNQVFRNRIGISLSTSDENTISYNNASFNSAGIKLTYRSTMNNIDHNLITGNNGVGIHVLDFSDSIIEWNTVTGNDYGMNLYDSTNMLNSNIACNNFLGDIECKQKQNATGNTCYTKATTCEFSCVGSCPAKK